MLPRNGGPNGGEEESREREVKTFPIQRAADWYWNRPQKTEPGMDTTARVPENEQRKRQTTRPLRQHKQAPGRWNESA